MGFKNLPDIHAARHAKRIEHDVDRRAVLEIGHVLDGHDAGNDTLVAVAPGHLVAGLQLALHGDKDLDHLEHARLQLIARLEFLETGPVQSLKVRHPVVVAGLELLDGLHGGAVGHDDLPSLAVSQGVEKIPVDHGAPRNALGSALDGAAVEQVKETRLNRPLDDGVFVGPVLFEAVDFGAVNGLGALVRVVACTREDPHLDHGSLTARWHAKRRVAHIRGLFAEDGPQQLFFRSCRTFPLRGDLADEDVVGLDLGADCRRCPPRRDGAGPRRRHWECRA